MDYRKFLDRRGSLLLPYLGGPYVHAPARRLRVSERVAPGWWRFDVTGRTATPVGQESPPELEGLARIRGHLSCGWLFMSGGQAERLWLLPEDEPLALAPVCGRRWHGGDLLFDAAEFEQESVARAREALENEVALGDRPGVSPALRVAFGYALTVRVARRLDTQVGLHEVFGSVVGVAEGGAAAARALLQQIAATRARAVERAPRPTVARARRPVPAGLRPTQENAEERATEVLDAAGAGLLSTRKLAGRNLEVTFRFMGERFIALVDWESLHVYDAGICLAGEDEQLGLDSLPSVIREAIETGHLVITRT